MGKTYFRHILLVASIPGKNAMRLFHTFSPRSVRSVRPEATADAEWEQLMEATRSMNSMKESKERQEKRDKREKRAILRLGDLFDSQ
jgi:6-phosphofructokinase